jgi:hypothetical protein
MLYKKLAIENIYYISDVQYEEATIIHGYLIRCSFLNVYLSSGKYFNAASKICG